MAEGELVPGVDYYVEGGNWVFTAHYLRRRGYCCRSGCRHCPYGFREGGAKGTGDRAGEESPREGSEDR